jgi:hypothetical protein
VAGDWIKMRSALLQSPKLIALTRRLQQEREFRDWLTPGGGGSMNGQMVSDDALRCVTGALLLRVWSAAREHGTYRDNDLFLPCIEVSDLDVMAGVPTFGEAMQSVGWAKQLDVPLGVLFPNFKEFNVPLDPATKQKNYRERQKLERYDALPNASNEKPQNVTARVEKKRSKKHTCDVVPGFEHFWLAYPATGRKVAKSKCLEAWARNGLEDIASKIVAHVATMKLSATWQPDHHGKSYEPAPLTYLNQRRWEDGAPIVAVAPSRVAL